MPMKQMKTLTPPFKNEDSLNNSSSLSPLPDIVLCSALSTSILHGQRVHRERRRHKATVQTRGRESMEQLEVEDTMEPLVRSLQDLLQTTVSLHPDPAREEQVPSVSHKKRRRNISNSSTSSSTTATTVTTANTATTATTATKLSLVSAVATSSNTLKKDSLTLEDTPEGVFNGLKNLFKNVFAN